MLIVTYRDLLTGELAVDRHADLRAFDLAENNWSCDCNRSIAFGVLMHKRGAMVGGHGNARAEVCHQHHP